MGIYNLKMLKNVRSFLLLTFAASLAFVSACGVSTAEKQALNSNERRQPPASSVSDRPKIIAFGDSLTAGFGLTEKESYPYLLQEKLNADGYKYEVVNAGVSGETSLGGLERIDWVLEMENVEILILELGANDLLRNVPVKNMKANLDKIIRKAKEKNVKVLFCGMLAPPTSGSDYQRDYTNAFPDLADEHKVEFLPFILENIALKKELNQADGIHPNAQGAKIMTDNVYNALKPMLKQ